MARGRVEKPAQRFATRAKWGRRKWLSPSLAETIEKRARAGETLLIVRVAFRHRTQETFMNPYRSPWGSSQLGVEI